MGIFTHSNSRWICGCFYVPKNRNVRRVRLSGIDIRIYLSNTEYKNIQIKKESVSREVRAPWVRHKKGEEIVNISYEVTPHSKLTKTSKECKPYKDWEDKWRNKLQKLNNGFVIFLPQMFSLEDIKIP